MNVHWFQHVRHEDLGSMADWALARGHEVSYTPWMDGAQPPPLEEVDFLIVMGGPMGVYDLADYPWLEQELDYLRNFLATPKPVLGICLGSQLMAAALGARVYKGPHPEIGWHSVSAPGKFPEGWSFLPEETLVFQWHGDTFDLPDSAQHLYGSDDIPNQAFLYGGRALALQFHLETTEPSCQTLCREDAEYLQEHSDWARMAPPGQNKLFAQIREHLFNMLDHLVG